MVQADGGDDGEARPFQDVGGIQAPAQAGFDDGEVHLFIGKPLEGEAGGDLEEGKFVRDDPVHPLRQEGKDVFLGDHGAADAHALPEIQDMRRREQSRFERTPRAGRCEHIGHGALAVGAGDVYAPEGAGGASERLVEGEHPLQAGLVGTGGESVFLHRREAAEDVLDQF